MKKVLVPRVRFKGFSEVWKEEKLESFSEITIGEFVIKTKQNDFYEYPVYNGGITNTGFYKEYNNEGNKIIVSARGANTGYINFSEKRYWAGNSCYSIDLISKRHSNIKFIFYSMLINKYKFDDNKQVGTIPSVSLEDVKNFVIYLSSYSEQQKIGDFFSKIDTLINLYQSKLNKLKQLKETLLQKMFPEGNSKTPRIRFKGFEGEWKEERLENITKRMSSGGTPSTTIKKFYNGKIPFLTISDMTKVGKYINNTEKNITPEAIENSSTWLVPKNSLLLSMYASFGKTAINKKEITTSQAILGIILNNNISVEFLYYLLFLMDINQYWYKQVETGTQPNLSNWTVSKTLIKLTKNISEQQKIGDFFSKIDTLINLYQSKLNKLKQIKEALLQKMFV
ncbi:restriction endonuclease subunit S [Mycoplasmopsis felis]|uniref:restriction endonuclease subunit S n=1 Tax=Mycoplasmopsis felis TaxID=33923 RepID=UPI002AFEC9DF|nr:restriction endonuclease subunit S [Mycoplasmopsis felis]WQQ03215.1 restriction endonuclease subunit S [Mycoplasmopsis felis]